MSALFGKWGPSARRSKPPDRFCYVNFDVCAGIVWKIFGHWISRWLLLTDPGRYGEQHVSKGDGEKEHGDPPLCWTQFTWTFYQSHPSMSQLTDASFGQSILNLDIPEAEVSSFSLGQIFFWWRQRGSPVFEIKVPNCLGTPVFPNLDEFSEKTPNGLWPQLGVLPD